MRKSHVPACEHWERKDFKCLPEIKSEKVALLCGQFGSLDGSTSSPECPPHTYMLHRLCILFHVVGVVPTKVLQRPPSAGLQPPSIQRKNGAFRERRRTWLLKRRNQSRRTSWSPKQGQTTKCSFPERQLPTDDGQNYNPFPFHASCGNLLT